MPRFVNVNEAATSAPPTITATPVASITLPTVSMTSTNATA
jgi:hypothetical protein